MAAPLAHIALNADDPEASRAFYEAVFGWTFEPWGPPGFFHITMGRPVPVIAAMQQRRELVEGPHGVEATFAVDDLPAVLERVAAAGGEVVMDTHTIEGVGDLAFFTDPAGTPVGAMQFLADPAGV